MVSSKPRVVLPGGSGQVGTLLARAFHARGWDVTVLSRHADSKYPWRSIAWDAVSFGPWEQSLEGADVVINLAGQNVNCRYTPENRRTILESRVQSTRVLGQAIRRRSNPPRVWLQASTATIYAHTYGAANDEFTGVIGGNEPDAPPSWRFSIEVAQRWERTAGAFESPATRLVLLRSAMTMSPDPGGVFDVLLRLVRFGLGGTAGDGRQFVSWIHEDDFVASVFWLIEHGETRGPVNPAPNPLPNREFMAGLRRAWGSPIGLPAPRALLALGARLMRTETELVLKSRRVIPGVLSRAGFEFAFPTWAAAADDLCRRWRSRKTAPRSV
ncbi:TIGR01777 family protein [Opitutaceae bacterium EW11]|nr:TIGR01777 family protein [Opitutaceae bacterium EW11]